MLTNNLVSRVALYALSAGIPACDDPVRIEHVERVVGDPGHEKTKLALAVPQRFLGGLTLSNVARYFRKAFKLSLGITDRIDDDQRPEAASILADAPTFSVEPPFARRDFQHTS